MWLALLLGAITVDAEGLALRTGKTAKEARDAAIADALRNAVATAAGQYVQAEFTADEREAQGKLDTRVRDHIRVDTRGFVERFDVLDEQIVGDSVRVRIRAQVSTAHLGHLLRSKHNRPRLVVLPLRVASSDPHLAARVAALDEVITAAAAEGARYEVVSRDDVASVLTWAAQRESCRSAGCDEALARQVDADVVLSATIGGEDNALSFHAKLVDAHSGLALARSASKVGPRKGLEAAIRRSVASLVAGHAQPAAAPVQTGNDAADCAEGVGDACLRLAHAQSEPSYRAMLEEQGERLLDEGCRRDRKSCARACKAGCKSCCTEQPVDKDAALEGTRAPQVLKASCDKGVVAACTRLGQLYEFGRGVEPSETEADVHYARGLSLSTEACDKRAQAAACCEAAWFYRFGKGIEPSEGRAKKYDARCVK